MPVVPNLQKLPADWTGGTTSSDCNSIAEMKRIEVNTADNLACNTYFYTPTDTDPDILKVGFSKT